MSVHHECAYYPWEPEKGMWSPRARVRMAASHLVGTANWTQILWGTASECSCPWVTSPAPALRSGMLCWHLSFWWKQHSPRFIFKEMLVLVFFQHFDKNKVVHVEHAFFPKEKVISKVPLLFKLNINVVFYKRGDCYHYYPNRFFSLKQTKKNPKPLNINFACYHYKYLKE